MTDATDTSGMEPVVTQADRDAAAAYMDVAGWPGISAVDTKAGYADRPCEAYQAEGALVQAFARHRLATPPQDSAEPIDNCNCGLSKYGAGDHHEYCLFKPKATPTAPDAALREALKRAGADLQLCPRHNRHGAADRHIEESRDRIRDALAAHPPQTTGAGEAIPAGWKLVPVEITDDMRAAIAGLTSVDTAIVWERLLAASPAPPIADDLRVAVEELRALAALIERPPLDDVQLDQSVALRSAKAIRTILAALTASDTLGKGDAPAADPV